MLMLPPEAIMRCIEYLPPISRSAALKSSFSSLEREGVRFRDAPFGVDDYFRAAAADVDVKRVLFSAAARRSYERLRRGVDYFGLFFAGDYFHVDVAFFFYLGEHLGAVFRVAHCAGRAGAVVAHAEGFHEVVEGLHRLAEPRAALFAYRAAREGVLA